MASPPRRRAERRSYLFCGESAPFQEAGLAGPLAIVGRRRLAETSGSHLRRSFGPVLVALSDRLPGRRVVDATPAKVLANAPGAMAAATARADELLGEPRLAEQPLRFERIEHAGDRVGTGAARGKLERKLAARVLPAREQIERPRPELRIALAAQASSASPAPAAALRPGRSISRNAVSIALAMSSCSLRNSRTLSRPWPIRSPW